MNYINPSALILILFCTCLGALLGSWLVGTTVGSGIILLATLIARFNEQ